MKLRPGARVFLWVLGLTALLLTLPKLINSASTLVVALGVIALLALGSALASFVYSVLNAATNPEEK